MAGHPLRLAHARRLAGLYRSRADFAQPGHLCRYLRLQRSKRICPTRRSSGCESRRTSRTAGVDLISRLQTLPRATRSVLVDPRLYCADAIRCLARRAYGADLGTLGHTLVLLHTRCAPAARPRFRPGSGAARPAAHACRQLSFLAGSPRIRPVGDRQEAARQRSLVHRRRGRAAGVSGRITLGLWRRLVDADLGCATTGAGAGGQRARAPRPHEVPGGGPLAAGRRPRPRGSRAGRGCAAPATGLRRGGQVAKGPPAVARAGRQTAAHPKRGPAVPDWVLYAAGGNGPANRWLERRQHAGRPRSRAAQGDRGSPGAGREPGASHSTIAHGKYAARGSRRRGRVRVVSLGDAPVFSDQAPIPNAANAELRSRLASPFLH